MKSVLDFILEIVREIGEEQDNVVLTNPDKDTKLFGEHLDSMGIVFLITDLEAKISDELDVHIVLADERAMSQKTSPFRSVKTLLKYTQKLINEQKVG